MGKIETDHTGSGGGITLSSDGTSLLLDGTAIGGGGGGADLYAAETTGSTDPTATGTLSLAIGSNAQADGNDSIAIGLDAVAGLDGISIGKSAGNGTLSGGNYNLAIGRGAASNLTTGDSNTAVGRSALAAGLTGPLTGSQNTAIGLDAGAKVSSGSNNFMGGAQAGNAITSGSQNTFIGYNSDGVANSSNQTALGYQAISGGASATALTNSYASGSESFAAAIANNTSSYGATGANSIAIGYQAKASGEYSVSFGPSNNVSGAYSGAYGRGNTISGGGLYTGYAFGAENTVSSGLAFAFGSKASAATNKFAFSTSRFSSNGDAQQGKYILRSDTTDATAEALTTNNGTADTTNQVVLPNNSAYSFHGTIVARQKTSDGTASAAWKVEGLIRREGSAGTTVLVASTVTALSNTPSWGMALTADTTNGGLAITATGAAATNIRWVATINTSEVTYA